MRKILFTLAFVIILALALTGTASANGGPHGGYTATTDACAGCHRAHTAVGPNLLVETSTYALCMTCHGSTAGGADTDVLDGYYLHTRSSSAEGQTLTGDYNGTMPPPGGSPTAGILLGGGFAYYRGIAITSTHDATGASGRAAWGNGDLRTDSTPTNIADTQFNCASCHDPHGSSNYRILKTTVNGTHAVSVSVVDEGAANKDYDNEHWAAPTFSGATPPLVTQGQSMLCAGCHSSYHVTRADSGTDKTTNGTGDTDYGGDVTTFSPRGHAVGRDGQQQYNQQSRGSWDERLFPAPGGNRC